MRKVIIVAIREFITAIKSKAFIITLVLMPVMMLGSLVANEVLEGKVDLHDKKLAVVDRTGVLFDALLREAKERDETEAFETPEDGSSAKPKQVLPRFLLERVEEDGGDEGALLAELSERVRKEEIFGFAVIDRAVLDPPTKQSDPLVRYYSNTPTFRDLRRWLEKAVTKAAQGWRFNESGLDRKTVTWALQPTDLESFGLFTVDPKTGEVHAAEKVNPFTSFIIPIMLVMLIFVVIMVGASPLIQSVLEEKNQRIAEVLLASVTPFQWMMGKLIGMVGVSFVIVVLYMSGGLILAKHFDVIHLVPLNLLGWFLAYQAISVLMFGSAFIAVGAACSDHREAQSAIMPVMLVIVLPMMVLGNVVREPNTLFATAMSLFPPATPMLMLVRQAIPPGVDTWQPVLGMVLILLTTVAGIFAAGRIFRIGILAQGKGANFRDMIRWVVRG